MNHLDYVIIAIMALGALYGLSRGALRMATSILSIILGIAAATAWYERVAAIIQQHFSVSPTVAGVIGYIAVFIAVAWLIELIGRRLLGLAQTINLGWIDRLGGALFGAAVAVAFIGIDLVLLPSMLPPDSTLISQSWLAPHVRAFNKSLVSYVPADARELFERKRDELVHYWNGEKQSPAGTPSSEPSGT